MPIDTGWIQLGGGDVYAFIYYEQGWVANPPPGKTFNDAPLVDGPRGFCLDLTNVSGATATLEVSGLTNNPMTVNIGQGDPVTTGPANGRSRTAAQMAALGFTTRGSVGQVSIG